MQPLHVRTPLIHSQHLKSELGKNVYFKVESMQPSGSFKLRGIGRLCQQVCHEGAQSLVASSGGNAGVAVAYSGMKLNKPTTIFIPSSSHPIYIEAIESFGATVIVAGSTVGEAQISAEEFANIHQARYIHPYDHPEIWKGHASIIDEVASAHIRPDAVVVSVGGGGLACGVLEGMHQHGWHNVPLFAVETVGADVFSQSVNKNQPVILSSITSKATSLGATYVTPKLLDWTKKHTIKNVVVTDEQADQGSRLFANDQRILVELASGASLSLIYENHAAIRDYKSILVIACGGINTSHFNI